MSKQIFKNSPPTNLLYSLLDKIAVKNNSQKYYIVNKVAFKKGIYNNLIIGFLEELKPYYHNSKVKYLEKILNYNAFITVIRQICNNKNITYKSQIKYDKSNYEIVYYINCLEDCEPPTA
jgi:hypothetical protein